VDQQISAALAAQAQKTEIANTIEGFAKAPGHEHFPAVKQLMGHLMKSGQAADMQDAYDKAIWATPSIRSQLMAPVVDKGRTDKARKAAGTTLRGVPGNQAPIKRDTGSVNGSVIDDVRAAFQQLSGS
jgi:hypothetical protein